MGLMCRRCHSKQVTKNGHTRHGKQNFEWQTCGKQFCENPQNMQINDLSKSQIQRLLLERISLRGICLGMRASLRWLLDFFTSLYQQLPHNLHLALQPNRNIDLFCLDCEADEMWSFVANKGNKQWIWLAIDTNTKQVIGFHIGDRSAQSAKRLMDSLPEVYRNKADFFTDDWEAYKSIIPSQRHYVSKAQTTSIERLNLTLRQRVSRLVLQNLAFSKKLENHIGAIKYFLCDYNLRIQKTLPV